MAVCINGILEPTQITPASDSPEAEATNFGLYNKQGELAFTLPFIDSINNATKSLAGVNCSKEVNDWLTKQYDKLKSKPSTDPTAVAQQTWFGKAIAALDELGKDINKGIDKVENGVSKIEKMLCKAIIPFFKTLTSLIDLATKLLPILYKKILKLRAKLQAALVDFTNTVKACIMSVVNELHSSLGMTINQKVKPLVDTTLAFMKTCPCIMDIIGTMFDCLYDDQGNKFTTPEEVYACIKDKYAFLDPTVIIDVYNNAVNKYLVDNITSAFTFIENIISTTLELLLLPIRELMRIYGKALNTKIDMSAMLDTIDPFDCLFIYTTEYDGAGGSYKGMSVIDMINSIKAWSSCFELACSSFNIESTSWLKSINDKLKLDERFWRDANIIDLYQATIGYKLQAYPPSALMIRKLFTTNDTTGKKTVGDIGDLFKQLGKQSAKNVTFNNPFPKDAKQADAVKYSVNKENDIPTVNGFSDLNTGIEKRLMQMETTLGADSDDYYVSKFAELTGFETKFAKSDAHNKQIYKISTNQITITTNTTSSVVLMQPITSRQTYDSEPLPIYSISNDYSQAEADKIESSTLPPKKANESMVEYYKRCFSTVA